MILKAILFGKFSCAFIFFSSPCMYCNSEVTQGFIFSLLMFFHFLFFFNFSSIYPVKYGSYSVRQLTTSQGEEQKRKEKQNFFNSFSRLMYLIPNSLMNILCQFIYFQASNKLLRKAYNNTQWAGFLRAKGRVREERGEDTENK